MKTSATVLDWTGQHLRDFFIYIFRKATQAARAWGHQNSVRLNATTVLGARCSQSLSTQLPWF